MRIGFDGRYSGNHFPGIGRYSVGLARALAEIDRGHTLVLILDPRDKGRYDLAAIGRLPGVELAPLAVSPFSLRQQLALPALARGLRLDVLHSPYFIKPYLGLPCPSVVTIYDLIGLRFPGALSRRGRLLFRAAMGLAVRSADAILTISGSARDDLVSAYGPRKQIFVTPLAAGRSFRPRGAPEVAAVRERYGLPGRYVLYVGSNKPHKNLERLVAAWELICAQQRGAAERGVESTTLVIAGHEARRDDGLRQSIAERGLADKVRLVPNVGDGDLPALYSGASVFAFPSYYEGFGLPPLEAMACGAPVLCGATSSLPEVVGDAALTVDPYSVAALAEGLARLLGDPALRRALSERGQQRARQFSWRRTALGTLRAYEAVSAAR